MATVGRLGVLGGLGEAYDGEAYDGEEYGDYEEQEHVRYRSLGSLQSSS
jgi:hypothetical protein